MLNIEHITRNQGFIRQDILIDEQYYEVYKRQNVFQTPGVPRLVVVSYLPEKITEELLRICIGTIKLYTDIPYELWVIDNNSAFKRLKWLLKEEDINLVFNRTNPKESGSYANAIGLEIAVRVIDPKSQYLMTFHQDTAVCKNGWLQYLLSKINGSVRAAGVRFDTVRVEDGILHVLGYLIDLEIFRNLNLSFFPELPQYDVGDKAIVELKRAGYGIFATPNTHWDKELIENLPSQSPYRQIMVDRSFDDQGDVFFLHLGRGVLKSKQGGYFNKDYSISMWINFCRNVLLKKDSKKRDSLYFWEKVKKLSNR